ncbi:hypothetical protein DFQ29_001307 [Apophysomyces sp. BC1021]|nr:hypothetical protein DFQ29_001307 [Apophysomyces sp. BC1021]
MAHAAESLTFNKDVRMDVDKMDEQMQLDNQTMYDIDSPWVTQRKNTVIKYLERHRIPMRYDVNDPVIHVLGCARVEPPYTATSVSSDNAMIRIRVRDLVMKIP